MFIIIFLLSKEWNEVILRPHVICDYFDNLSSLLILSYLVYY